MYVTKILLRSIVVVYFLLVSVKSDSSKKFFFHLSRVETFVFDYQIRRREKSRKYREQSCAFLNRNLPRYYFMITTLRVAKGTKNLVISQVT